MREIDNNYTKFYLEKRHINIYPTEFVVRTFLANYPQLNMKKPSKGSVVIDVGCGDGRNTLFLCQQGYDVYGTEITEEICQQVKNRIKKTSEFSPKIEVGRNSALPYNDEFADCILACHSCYYVDQNETIKDNLAEYSRVMKKGGILVASLVHADSYILQGGDKLLDGTTIVRHDPYNNRNGYRLHSFATIKEIKELFSDYFDSFSFGQGHNNWYGIDENVWWVVCTKK